MTGIDKVMTFQYDKYSHFIFLDISTASLTSFFINCRYPITSLFEWKVNQNKWSGNGVLTPSSLPFPLSSPPPSPLLSLSLFTSSFFRISSFSLRSFNLYSSLFSLHLPSLLYFIDSSFFSPTIITFSVLTFFHLSIQSSIPYLHSISFIFNSISSIWIYHSS